MTDGRWGSLDDVLDWWHSLAIAPAPTAITAVSWGTLPAASLRRITRISDTLGVPRRQLPLDMGGGGDPAGGTSHPARAFADGLVDGGTDLVLLIDSPLSPAESAAAIASAALFTGADEIDTHGWPDSATSDNGWMDLIARCRDLAATAQGPAGPWIATPEGAAITALLQRLAERRTPVFLSDLASCVSALCASEGEPSRRNWFWAAHLSNEPAHAAVLHTLGLKPTLQLGIPAGTGAPAVLLAHLLAGLFEDV